MPCFSTGRGFPRLCKGQFLGVGLLQVTDPFQGFQGEFLLNVLAHGIGDCFVFVSYFRG